MDAAGPAAAPPEPRDRRLALFQLAVVVPTLAGGLFMSSQRPEGLRPELLLWALLIAGVELLPVPAWHGLRISVGFPLLMMVGILYPPIAAGWIALIGASDPREFKREVPFGRALFNRCQVALSVFAASSVFWALADIDTSAPPALIGAAMAAAVADYVVNSGLVTVYASMLMRISPLDVIRRLRIGRLPDFLASYMGLGILGLALAVLFREVGAWSLPAYLAPLLFARQMFLRSQALEEAHRELQEREQVLKSLSNAMAEERADERTQIAGYLHDDLAQVLFRLSIHVDVARKLLDRGAVDETIAQLEKIRESKNETSDRIRALIRDLHRSPLGAKGLSEALESFTEEVGKDSSVTFHRDVQDIDLPAPIALLIYHIAREGVMNALKHAQAEEMWIAVREIGDSIELQLRDNGVGFNPAAPGPEGHYGMAMMRERAQVGGGSFDAESAPGAGTTITVRFPTSLLQEVRREAEAETGENARGTGPRTEQEAGSSDQDVGGSRQAVRA